MARFLTFEGRVVVDEFGTEGDKVAYRCRGDADSKYQTVPAARWHKLKKFEYFDNTKMSRQAAIRQFETAQKQKKIP